MFLKKKPGDHVIASFQTFKVKNDRHIMISTVERRKFILKNVHENSYIEFMKVLSLTEKYLAGKRRFQSSLSVLTSAKVF